jgi:cytochrome b561
MGTNDLTKKFSKATVATHWLTSLLILILFPLGKYMERLGVHEKMGLLKIHIILGMLVFILTLIRTFTFFKHERPENLKTGSKLNDKLAVWIHNTFYFLLFAISISGIGKLILGGYGEAMQTGGLKMIKSIEEIPSLKFHSVTAILLMVLFALHVLGVIKHYVFTKENTLRRIS